MKHKPSTFPDFIPEPGFSLTMNNSERESEAKERLMLGELKTRVNHLRHGELLYIFELWSSNPDLLK